MGCSVLLVLCVVSCDTLNTSPCVSTCARGAGIHGDVLNVHTRAIWMDTRGAWERGGGRRQPRVFIGKTSDCFDISSAS